MTRLPPRSTPLYSSAASDVYKRQDYTSKHFGDEEALQLRYKYPDYANHKQYHEGFKRVVRELAEQLNKEGPTVVLVGKVNSSIAGWLINHIKREDVKVAAHVRAQGGK